MLPSKAAEIGNGAFSSADPVGGSPRPAIFQLFGLPPPLLGVLGVGLAFVAFLAFDQSHWWSLRPDYAFGWLVPFFVVYVVADRLPRLGRLARGGGGSPLPAWLGLLASAGAGLVLGVGVLVFLIGAAYRAGDGPSQPGSLALAVGFAGILLGAVYWAMPAGTAAEAEPAGVWAALRADRRLRAAGLFLFPALIWMVSAPLASAVENAVSLFLLRKVVTVVFAIFSGLGLPLLQEGNVLILPHGQVGVADACSGIRSLTGCLFAGSFLAAVYLDRFWKKALLVAAAMLLAFFTNLLRSLFLTGWAYAYGSDAIEGSLHDGTGFAVLGLTTIGLFCLLPLFRSRAAAAEPAST